MWSEQKSKVLGKDILKIQHKIHIHRRKFIICKYPLHHLWFWCQFWLSAYRHQKIILMLSYIQDTWLMLRKSVSFSSAALCLRQWQQNVCVLLNDKAHLLFLMLATCTNGRLNEWLMACLNPPEAVSLYLHNTRHVHVSCWRMVNRQIDVISIQIMCWTYLCLSQLLCLLV